jgi:hypothetical protein
MKIGRFVIWEISENGVGVLGMGDLVTLFRTDCL